MTCTEPVVAGLSAPTPRGSYAALVVDDEQRIRAVVARALELEGIRADTAADAASALAILTARRYDLVILDLVMPGQDGFSALDDIMRLNPDQAVLVLSGLADAPSKVRSLNLGAEDYLAKPFHVEELRARVRARLRSLHRSSRTTIDYGRMSLDLVTHRVTMGHRRVQLAEREFQLLCELVSHSGRVVTKTHLLTHVWGYGPEESTNVVDVYIRRLRSRLGEDVIETVRGQGYCCVP